MERLYLKINSGCRRLNGTFDEFLTIVSTDVGSSFNSFISTNQQEDPVGFSCRLVEINELKDEPTSVVILLETCNLLSIIGISLTHN